MREEGRHFNLQTHNVSQQKVFSFITPRRVTIDTSTMPKPAQMNAKILVDPTILFTKRRLGVVQPYAIPRYSMFFETYLLKLFCIFASLRDTFVRM